MRALDRKLLRDLWHMKGQAVAIALVIAAGVATYVLSVSTLQSLRRTQDRYYERYRFAHVFAHLKRAPNPLADRIAEIPGVAQVQTRIVEQVTLDVPVLPEPAVGRLISIPEYPAPGLNGLYLRSGRWVEPGRTGEVLASEGFAQAHRLGPGDRISAVINGRRQRLTVVGVALSPEYVYAIRPGDLLPDEKRFGIFWMGYTDLAAAFNMQGAFNDIALTLTPGASEPEVLRRLDRLTESYGGLGAYGRADQTSNRFINNEINELRGMAQVVPTIFLAVAAFLLHIVISRLIGTQREQIATLKAFGYTSFEVGQHYLRMVLLVVIAGAIIGTVLGVWLGRGLTEIYTSFFRFPVFEYRPGADVILLAVFVSAAAAAAGTLGAVLRAMRLPPAEAMRPEPPASFGPTFLERLGLQRLFSSTARMILRQLERQPLRSLLSALSIALAVAVCVLGSFMKDAVEYLMETQFAFAQRQQMSVTFDEPTSGQVLYELAHLPGVRHCEPFRAIAVRLRFGARERRVSVLGLPAEGKLFRVIDRQRRAVPLPPEGLVLSAKLAELLDVRVGDVLMVEVLEGERPVRPVPVVALVNDLAGTDAYMEVEAVRRLMRESDVMSGAFLATDTDRTDELYTALKNTPHVAGVAVTQTALTSFRKTIAENLLRMRFFNVLFAGVIAFGVVYNSARIALSERSRELATLRVLGYTRAEVSLILLGELAVLTLVAIPVGLTLGYGLAALVIRLAYNTELFRMPLVIDRSTYAFAATVTLVAALVSGLVVRRRIDRLDLVAVLKSKE